MIGVYGGTFDPVHYGHLRTALEVKEHLQLEEILFVPCAQPPHRTAPSASAEHRITMLKLGIHEMPGFRVDTRELEREGYSYTTDTLASLRQEDQDRTVCLIVGMDAFLGFPGWYRWQDLFELAHIVVMLRPGTDLSLTEPLESSVSERRVSKISALKSNQCGLVFFQPVTLLDISSTGIRNMIRQGDDPRYLLPDSVWAMIREKTLYQI